MNQTQNPKFSAKKKKRHKKTIFWIFFLVIIIFILLVIEAFLIFLFFLQKTDNSIKVQIQGATEEENKILENYINK